jgi:hypothetical protein
MSVGLDRDGPFEGGREGLGHLAVPRARIDEHAPGRESLHRPLQPAPRVALLVGMVEEDLKRVFVVLALAVEDADALFRRHSGSSGWRVV